MYYFFILIAIVWGWGVWGVLTLFSPKSEKEIALMLGRFLPFWTWGIISLCIAVLFWYSSEIVSNIFLMKLFAVSIGLKGVLTLGLSEAEKKLLSWWINISPLWNRAVGLVSVVLIIYILSQVNF